MRCALPTRELGNVLVAPMGKTKKTRKFAEVKRMINPKDSRIT